MIIIFILIDRSWIPSEKKILKGGELAMTQAFPALSVMILLRSDTYVLPELFRGKFLFSIFLRENV